MASPASNASTRREAVPGQAEPDSSTLVSTTSLTHATIGSGRLNFGVDVLDRHRGAGGGADLIQQSFEFPADAAAADFLGEHGGHGLGFQQAQRAGLPDHFLRQIFRIVTRALPGTLARA